MTDTQLTTPFGTFVLHRLPRSTRELLRAWDAADEYLLNTLAEEPQVINQAVICNDSFGVLSVALNSFHPVNWSDSFTAHQAARLNLKMNNLNTSSITYLDSVHVPDVPLDLVIIKVPKTLALFEYQLTRLKPVLTEKSQIFVAGMVKSMPSSVWKILERIIGPTKTYRAVKKAKIIQVTNNINISLTANTKPVEWKLDGSDYLISNHANVFSREKLDIGTRFFLQNIPQTTGSVDIVDLGCGNGVLGLMAANQNREARIHFIDESYMAIESARVNYNQVSPELLNATFHVNNDMSEFADQSFDLVLCNPPFHQLQAVGSSVAISMFKGSARVLKANGELWIIGNRHLAYHKKLQNYFNRVALVASNKKFVIFKASDPRVKP